MFTDDKPSTAWRQVILSDVQPVEIRGYAQIRSVIHDQPGLLPYHHFECTGVFQHIQCWPALISVLQKCDTASDQLLDVGAKSSGLAKMSGVHYGVEAGNLDHEVNRTKSRTSTVQASLTHCLRRGTRHSSSWQKSAQCIRYRIYLPGTPDPPGSAGAMESS